MTDTTEAMKKAAREWLDAIDDDDVLPSRPEAFAEGMAHAAELVERAFAQDMPDWYDGTGADALNIMSERIGELWNPWWSNPYTSDGTAEIARTITKEAEEQGAIPGSVTVDFPPVNPELEPTTPDDAMRRARLYGGATIKITLPRTRQLPKECKRCHECSQEEPDWLLPCHPIAECDDTGDPVFKCKHCPRATPWLDDDELDERQQARRKYATSMVPRETPASSDTDS